jgi:hypothetical protein
MVRDSRIASAGSVAFVVAILTLVSLSFALFFSSTDGSQSSSKPSLITNTQTSASLSAKSAGAAAATSRVTPLLVRGDLGNFEPIPISIVGPTSACAMVSAASPGSAPSAHFTVVLHATKPLNLPMASN